MADLDENVQEAAAQHSSGPIIQEPIYMVSY